MACLRRAKGGASFFRVRLSDCRVGVVGVRGNTERCLELEAVNIFFFQTTRETPCTYANYRESLSVMQRLLIYIRQQQGGSVKRDACKVHCVTRFFRRICIELGFAIFV